MRLYGFIKSPYKRLASVLNPGLQMPHNLKKQLFRGTLCCDKLYFSFLVRAQRWVLQRL